MLNDVKQMLKFKRDDLTFINRQVYLEKFRIFSTRFFSSNNSQISLINYDHMIKKSVYYCGTQLLFKPLHLNRVIAVLIRKG